MSKLFSPRLACSIAALAFAVSVSTTAQAGMAMCEFATGADGSGSEYQILKDALTDSNQLESALRRQLREEHGAKISLRCRRFSGPHGEYTYIIGRNSEDDDGERKLVYGVGFGDSAGAAEKDLVKHLARRDWLWIHKKHGLGVVESGSFVEPDRNSECYKLLRYRDRKLIKDLDSKNAILRKAARASKIFKAARDGVSREVSVSKVLRRLEASLRITEIVAEAVTAHSPAAQGIYLAKDAVAIAARLKDAAGNSTDYTKALRYDVLDAGSNFADVISNRSKVAGQALGGHVSVLSAGVKIIEAKQSDDDWKESIGVIDGQLAEAEAKIDTLRESILNSEARINYINGVKNFIDEKCPNGLNADPKIVSDPG